MTRCALAVLLALTISPTLADDADTNGAKTDAEAKAQADAEAAQKAAQAQREAYRKANEPGPHHERLAKFAGKWRTQVTRYRPEGNPLVDHGIAIYTVILGGRAVEEEFRTEMMGQAYEGRALHGYDNIKGKYVTTWISNMETRVIVTEGEWDEEAKTITSNTTLELPTGESVNLRRVECDVDEDTRIVESYVTRPDAEEYKHMEVRYTRVKS